MKDFGDKYYKNRAKDNIKQIIKKKKCMKLFNENENQ